MVVKTKPKMINYILFVKKLTTLFLICSFLLFFNGHMLCPFILIIIGIGKPLWAFHMSKFSFIIDISQKMK